MLEVSGLSIAFGGLIALDDVSLNVKSDEIHGLIGPNGAGKTTFFNAVTGLISATKGTIQLAGQDITKLPAHKRATAGIRRSFQSVQLIGSMTVLENVLIGLHGSLAMFGQSRWRSPIGATRRDAQAQGAVVDVLASLGLSEFLLTQVDGLTFAQQRFVEIARAVVSRPRLLMLDEPAAGLSASELAFLNRLIRRLRDDWGISILLVEHVLSLIFDVSDTVSVLDNGRLICRGAPREIARDTRVRAAYLGEQADALT